MSIVYVDIPMRDGSVIAVRCMLVNGGAVGDTPMHLTTDDLASIRRALEEISTKRMDPHRAQRKAHQHRVQTLTKWSDQ